jgi:CheY-like chemotaxis protein
VAVLQIRSVLEEAGYTVRVAANGEDGLTFVKGTVPDGVILDLMMPGVDGFEMLEQIRSTPATETLPVLILTAKELTAADRARLSQNHVHQLVRKGSLDREHLLACVNKLVRKQPEAPTGEPRSEVARPAANRDERLILIVEDNPDNRLTLEALLKERGCSFLTVVDGLQAVQAVREHRPALVLMDIHLPVLSGLDATRRIKSDSELQNIPVVALTARAMKGDQEAVLAAGCDGYLAKPINPSDLWQLLEQWLPDGRDAEPRN